MASTFDRKLRAIGLYSSQIEVFLGIVRYIKRESSIISPMTGQKRAITFGLMMLVTAILIVLTLPCVAPAEIVKVLGETNTSDGVEGLYAISAYLAASVALGAAGYGLAQISVANISAITEKSELFSLPLTCVIFLEAIGVYGLVIAFLIPLRL